MLVGRITARVIGHSQREVLVVPNNTTVGWKTIVLATDGSKFSALAADRAIAFAQSYGGELKVLSVVDVPTEFYAEAPQAVDDLVKKAKEYVARVKQQAEAAGVRVETFVGEAEARRLPRQDRSAQASHGKCCRKGDRLCDLSGAGSEVLEVVLGIHRLTVETIFRPLRFDA
jgi:hypothetical protein